MRQKMTRNEGAIIESTNHDLIKCLRKLSDEPQDLKTRRISTKHNMVNLNYQIGSGSSTCFDELF